MPLGRDPRTRTIATTDTAEVKVALYKEDHDTAYTEDELLSVQFTIQKPDRTQTTIAGEIDEDGVGILRYTDTTTKGEYLIRAQFTTVDGELKSVRTNFDVEDPFDERTLAAEVIGDAVWLKLEDLFDSEEGGPWLRDMSLRYFNKTKISQFVEDSLVEINLAPPDTNVTLDLFTFLGPNGEPNPSLPIIVQGTLLSTIRHLMRSYVEQPVPTGAPVVYEERRDYLDRWQRIYVIELERWVRWVALWKRQFLNYGHGSLLVGSKAGRMIGAPMRTRMAGRGYH